MENRINIVMELMKKICINKDYYIDLLDQVNYIDINYFTDYKINKIIINKNNYNNNLEKYYCKEIKEIINNEYDINFIIPNHYENKLNSIFISNKIKINIINNLFIKTLYKSGNRNIYIFSKNNIKINFIKKIDSIFNFFDKLTNKKNYYELFIYLSNEIKLINHDNKYINPDNINSGVTNKIYICIFRKEEILKVLFHEIIHYLNLDIFYHNDHLKYLYKDIKLKQNTITNPNEGYTEALTIILITIWRYKYYKNENENKICLKDFFNYSLKLELYWSFYQITKILKFFKCYNKYEDLFDKNNCYFKQKTNVLSYFILKSYLLFNTNFFFKDIKINSFNINTEIFDNINLLDKDFILNINKLMNINIIDNSLRMTLQF